MNRLLLLAGMLLAFDAQSEDVFKYGHNLIGHCINLVERNQLDSSGAFCHGYVLAIADVVSTQPVAGRRACFPNFITSDQVEKVVLNYLKRNPKLLDRSASSLAATALAEAFPCKK